MDKIILTKETARYWAIKKWESIVARNGDPTHILHDHPELAQFNAECSYCTFYGYNNTPSRYNNIDCNKCPISLIPEGERFPKGMFACNEEGQERHPFHKFSMDETLENAQAVLDLILNSPDKEDEDAKDKMVV